MLSTRLFNLLKSPIPFPSNNNLLNTITRNNFTTCATTAQVPNKNNNINLNNNLLTGCFSIFSSKSIHPIHNSIISRNFHISTPVYGLEEFFINQSVGRVGRSWFVHELRLKSFEDLHKLWFVLLKERNMLYTYRHQCLVNKHVMEWPDRLRKVRKSMAAIKFVLSERHHEFKRNVIDSDTPSYLAKREKIKLSRLIERKFKSRRKKKIYQNFRQKETHPLAKKNKFKHLKSRTSIEPTKRKLPLEKFVDKAQGKPITEYKTYTPKLHGRKKVEAREKAQTEQQVHSKQ